jgi:hypothetical protein
LGLIEILCETVNMTSTSEVFVAELDGPPRRRLWIARDAPVSAAGQTRGWSFIVDELLASGEWLPLRDTWEEWFFEILRYPPEYAGAALVWRREATGETVDMKALQPIFDGKPVASDETPESAGLE